MNIIDKIIEELCQEITSEKELDKKYLISQGNNNGFEKLMRNKIIPQFNSKAASMFTEEVKITERFGHHFPDMDVKVDDKLYGIELKSRNDGSWKTLGGSVLESTSNINDYEEIYILFASFNATKNETSYHIRYMPYWKATNAIKITHSPRFTINLDSDDHIFESNAQYKSFANSNDEETFKFIQDSLNKTTSKPHWYTSLSKELPPTHFNELNSELQDSIYAETLILFPYDLLRTNNKGNVNANYKNLQDYLIEEHYVLITRDQYSAGGKISINGIKFPRIVHIYKQHKAKIMSLLNSEVPEFSKLAYEKWNWGDNPQSSLEQDFKKILNYCGEKYFSTLLPKNCTLSEIIFLD